MTLRIRVRSGALAGRGFEFADGIVRVGRQPGLELSFDPEADRSVSALHAELRGEGGRWILRDQGSRNGTFVNGLPLGGPEVEGTELEDGDRITFGKGGPEVDVSMPGATSRRIRVEAGRQTRRLRVAILLMALVLTGALGSFLALSQARENRFDQERARLLEEADRALAELAAAAPPGEEAPPSSEPAGVEAPSAPRSSPGEPGDRAEVQALAEALRRSEAELREIRDALTRDPRPDGGAPGSEAETEALRRQLQEATAALRRQQLAGSLDLDRIQRENRPAVALVFVESANGDVVTGTAFAVRPDGTLLTVRHVVVGAAGAAPPRRLAVQFSDSEQVWPARLVAVSEEVDLAAVRVENIVGTVPVIRGINTRPDTLGTGVAVGSIGFPLGGASPSGPVRPLVTAGVLSSIRPTEIEVHGYGDVGASGSPIFDAAGEVVGVLFGGRAAEVERVLLAVNSVQVARFLGRIPRAGG